MVILFAFVTAVVVVVRELIAPDEPAPPRGRNDAALSGGTGLERYVHLEVETGVGGRDGDCVGFEPAATLFDDTLSQLWSEHPTFETGLPVLSGAATGEAVSLRATATLLDDDDAQGRTTQFWVELEARPGSACRGRVLLGFSARAYAPAWPCWYGSTCTSC